jgi:hypothetical protein
MILNNNNIALKFFKNLARFWKYFNNQLKNDLKTLLLQFFLALTIIQIGKQYLSKIFWSK